MPYSKLGAVEDIMTWLYFNLANLVLLQTIITHFNSNILQPKLITIVIIVLYCIQIFVKHF